MQNFVELDLKYAERYCSIPSFYLLCAKHAYKKDALKKERTASVYIVYTSIAPLIYMKVYPKCKTQGRGNMKTDTTLYGDVNGK
jgi:hypothetical protein